MFVGNAIRSTRIFVAAGAIILTSLSGAAEATVYTEFSLDMDASSVFVYNQHCYADCTITGGLNGDLATSGNSLEFGFSSLSDSLTIGNLLEWTISGTGLAAFSMALNMVFNSPDDQSVSSDGGGLIATFLGILTAGHIEWQTPTVEVAFDEGSVLAVTLEDGLFGSYDPYGYWDGGSGSIHTGVTFTPTVLTGLDTPSPVPLPAALPALLIVALGGLGLGWRHRRADGLAAD